MDDLENKNQPEEENVTPETEETVVENAEQPVEEAIAEENTVAESDEEAIAEENTVVESDEEATVLMEKSENAEEIAPTQEVVNSDETPVIETPAEPEKKNKNKKGLIIGLVAALIAVLLVIIGVLTVKLVKSNGTTSFKATDTVMTVGDVDCTAGEFSFYYSYMYSYYYQYIMYGQATTDDIKEMALNEIAYSSAVYSIAKENNFELTDEQIEANVTDTVQNYKEYAEENDMTLEEFLTKYYGKGFTEKLFTEIITKNTVATLYKTQVDDELLQAYYTEDGIKKVNEEYNENKKDYDTLAIQYYYFESEDEETTGTEASDELTAEEKANKLVTLVEGGQTFAGAIYNNFKTDDYSYTETTCPSVDECTYETLTSLSEDAAEWAFEQDDDGNYVRKIGDMKVIEASSMEYVIYVASTPVRDESYEVSYRDILVSFGDEDVTDEVLATTKEKADEILATFTEYVEENPDDSADNYFALLASSKSEDSNTASNGGLVEDVTEETDDVSKWALDSSRKTGDTSVIKGDDGYHVVYYTNASEHPVWFNTIAETLADADSSEKFADCENAFDSAEVNDDKIAAIIAYIEDAMNSASETEEDESEAN